MPTWWGKNLMGERVVRFGKKTGETISWYAPSPDYSNACCLYCGCSLRGAGAPKSDKEHLIARNFVPAGTMGTTAFNFIFRACRECNARKAHAERHVSSVTLFNSPGRRDDARAEDAAARKGRGDFHPRKKGALVQDAFENLTIKGSMGPMSLSFGMVAPPQVDMNLAGEVAFSQLQGMFSLITSEDYQDPQKMRLLPQEHFIWYDWYTHEDWGNPQAVEIARRVENWECLANITSADGYWRTTLRKSEQGWFWALEWNKQLRLVGGISNSRMPLFEGLPNEGWMPTPQGRTRRQIPLDPADDLLFAGVLEG